MLMELANGASERELIELFRTTLHVFGRFLCLEALASGTVVLSIGHCNIPEHLSGFFCAKTGAFAVS